MATTTSNFSWPIPQSTDLVKDGATAIASLGSGIDTSMAELKGGTTGQILSKTSGTDMDFTWITPNPGDITGVTAGTGITGGGTSGDVTVSFDVANYGGGQKAAGKNAVINGGFDIWQRGTSFSTAASASAYTADRWQVRTSGANLANTVSRQVTNDSTNLPFIQYCARVQRNSGQTGTNFFIYEQGLESVNSIPFAGKTVTLSFYARAGANFSSASSILISSIPNGTGTDQTPGVYTGGVYPTQNNTLTTTWQRFTHTYTVPTTATEIGVQLYYNPVGTAGANDYFEVTGVQLELGSTATPFSQAGGTIQGELAACQRYYYRNTPGSTYGAVVSSGVIYGSTTYYSAIQLPVQMRGTPSSLEWANLQIFDSANTTYAVTVVSLSSIISGPLLAGVEFNAVGLTAGRPALVRNANNTAGYLAFNAEL